MPAGRRSVVFDQGPMAPVVSTGRLRDATGLLTHLVLRAGFTVPEAWLA